MSSRAAETRTQLQAISNVYEKHMSGLPPNFTRISAMWEHDEAPASVKSDPSLLKLVMDRTPGADPTEWSNAETRDRVTAAWRDDMIAQIESAPSADDGVSSARTEAPSEPVQTELVIICRVSDEGESAQADEHNVNEDDPVESV